MEEESVSANQMLHAMVVQADSTNISDDLHMNQITIIINGVVGRTAGTVGVGILVPKVWRLSKKMLPVILWADKEIWRIWKGCPRRNISEGNNVVVSNLKKPSCSII